MAADLFRVVAGTTVSEPLDKARAMARFADCVSLCLDRVRVIREADYQPALFGAQNRPGVYRGEAARTPPPVHYGNLLTPTACDLTAETLGFADGVTLRSSQVTCQRCLSALTGQSGGSR